MDTFSAGAMIRFGWETFKKRGWFLVGAMLLYFAVIMLIGSILGEFEKIGSVVAAVCAVANWVVQVLAGMGMVAFLLKTHDDVAAVSLRDFWHPYPFWKYVFAGILKAAIAAGPLLVVVLAWSLAAAVGASTASVPVLESVIFGVAVAVACVWLVYISVRILFVDFLIIEKQRGPVEAIKESMRISKGCWWQLLALVALVFLVNVLGLVCLIVGFLVSMPVSALAIVHAYRELEHRSAEIIPAA